MNGYEYPNFAGNGLLCAALALLPAQAALAADWPMFGGDATNSLHAEAETIISPASVSNEFSPALDDGLQPRWTATVPGPIYKPVIAQGDAVYGMTASHAFRLDRSTGVQMWSKPLQGILSEAFPGQDLPPVGSETAPAILDGKLVITTAGSNDEAVDTDGAPAFPHQDPRFVDGAGFLVVMNPQGEVQCGVTVSENPYEAILTSPVVFEYEHKGQVTNLAVVGISGYEEGVAGASEDHVFTTRGKVTAVDLDTCEIVWNRYLIDADPGTPAYDAQKVEAGHVVADVTSYAGVTVWASTGSYDSASETVTFMTGNAYYYDTDADVSQPADLDLEQLPINAFVKLDVKNGKIETVRRVIPGDFWNTACIFGSPPSNCDFDVGPDFDFGAGANLVEDVPNAYGFDTDSDGVPDPTIDMYVAVNKNATVYRVEASTLTLLSTQSGDDGTIVGPSNLLGLAGTATDGTSIFAVNPNSYDVSNPFGFTSRVWTLGSGPNAGQDIYGGSVAAVHPVDGSILWENSDAVNFQPNSVHYQAILPAVIANAFENLRGFLIDAGLPEFLATFFADEMVDALKTTYGPLSDPQVQQGITDTIIQTSFLGSHVDAKGTALYLGAPSVANGVVFVPSVLPNLFNLPSPSFEGNWAGDGVALLANVATIAVPGDALHAYDAVTGERLWSSPGTGPAIASAAIADGVVYWGTIDVSSLAATSTVFAFEPAAP